MPRKAKGDAPGRKKPIEQYDHPDKQRVNNPPVGLVTPDTDPIDPPRHPGKKYQYDEHLDPQLQWAGKAERTSFEIPTVSLHVHERIDPKTIIQAVRARNGNGKAGQLPLFARAEENPPLRDAIEFYRHRHNWTNRLIAGDSLLVMNSLLEKEGLGGQVQMVYLDPPYGIRYGSNFQPFVNKRDVKDGADEDLTQEPEMLKAFRDTWELGIHSYLTYLRDRLLIARELLHESGSCFVQISEENIHHIREIMDDVFGAKNMAGLITVVKTAAQEDLLLPSVCDFIVWYAKDVDRVKYRSVWQPKTAEYAIASEFNRVELADASRRRMTPEEQGEWARLPTGSRVYRQDNIVSQRPPGDFPVEFEGRSYRPTSGYWKTGVDGFRKLINARRIEKRGEMLSYVRFFDDFPVRPVANFWTDVKFSSRSEEKSYVVQTAARMIERCLLMTTDPGDLVFDPTCGSGTTAFVAEQWGRRWITCDTSRVAITLAKQRLMTATFDYYTLAHPDQGVGSGFVYKTVPHVTLKSIANNPEIKEGMGREEIDRAIAKYAETETLYDQPDIDRSKARVTGPFTVEAVPAAAVRPVDSGQGLVDSNAESSFHSSLSTIHSPLSETLRQSEWRTELLKTGIRAKGGQKIEFVRVEPLPGTRWLSADAETKEDKPRRAVISFGPEHAPLEQRQVASALEEAQKLVPKPALVIFASLQFDPEAAKDIDETNWPGVIMLKAQMNGDLVTEDLKKKRSSNESFWLVGQPDIQLRKVARKHAHPSPLPEGEGEKRPHPNPLPKGEGEYVVEVHGFDYYNPKTGNVESGGKGNIAMWMLDTDYDGRSLYPRQVFFPMSGEKDGWARLARNLRAEIDPDLIEQYCGTVSLPFEPGKNRRIAVKIVDDRGIESLRIVEVP